MKKKIRAAILLRALWLGWALSCALPLQAADIAVHGFGTLGVACIDKPDDWAYSRFLNQRSSTSDVRADLDSVLSGMNLPPQRLNSQGAMIERVRDDPATIGWLHEAPRQKGLRTVLVLKAAQ